MFDQRQRLLGVEVLKAQSVSTTLKRFGRYFVNYKLSLGLAALFVILSTLMFVSIPLLLGQVVDCYLTPLVRTSGSLESCWYTTVPAGAPDSVLYQGLGGIILLILGIYTASALIVGSQFYAMSWAGAHVLRDLRRDVFRHMHRLSLSFFSKNEAGDIMSRFTNDTDTLQQIMGFGLVQVMSGLLQVIFVVLAMFFTNLPFAIVGLLTLPLCSWRRAGSPTWPGVPSARHAKRSAPSMLTCRRTLPRCVRSRLSAVRTRISPNLRV